MTDQVNAAAGPLKKHSAHHLYDFAFGLETAGTDEDFIERFLWGVFDLISPACNCNGALPRRSVASNTDLQGLEGYLHDDTKRCVALLRLVLAR